MRKVIDSIVHAWHPTTAAPGCAEAQLNKPHGQCAVTALLVQDLIGGDIVRGVLTRAGHLVGDGPSAVYLNASGSHYWNRIVGVGDIDLTLEQFPEGIYPIDGVIVPRSRLLEGERAVDARTAIRYEILKARFESVCR